MTQTKHDLFEAWKSNDPKERWKEYWQSLQFQNLDMMFERGFWVIALGEKTKRPSAGYLWADKALTHDQALFHLGSNGNLGVVAGLSNPKLVILDYDSTEGPDFPNTLTSYSPNGKHIFTQGEYNENMFKKLKKLYPKFDLCRAGNGYVVVPLSETCSKEHSKHECEKDKHDYRLHQWIDPKAEIIPFEDFVRSCL